MPDYRPVDPRKSPRFAGIKTFMRLPHIETTEGIDFAVVGVPFDTGASYRVGARFGPEAIRSVSALLRHYNQVLDVGIFDHCSGVDYGDLPVNPGYTEDSYEMIEEGLKPLLDAGVVPIMLGGDHSVTLPELRAVAKKYGPVALIHFDCPNAFLKFSLFLRTVRQLNPACIASRRINSNSLRPKILFFSKSTSKGL